jgi:hypothetical protein
MGEEVVLEALGKGDAEDVGQLGVRQDVEFLLADICTRGCVGVRVRVRVRVLGYACCECGCVRVRARGCLRV